MRITLKILLLKVRANCACASIPPPTSSTGTHEPFKLARKCFSQDQWHLNGMTGDDRERPGIWTILGINTGSTNKKAGKTAYIRSYEGRPNNVYYAQDCLGKSSKLRMSFFLLS